MNTIAINLCDNVFSGCLLHFNITIWRNGEVRKKLALSDCTMYQDNPWAGQNKRPPGS